MVLTDEERKAKRKQYLSRPEVKAKVKVLRDRYLSRPEVKARAKERNQTPENKARARKYGLRPEVKAKVKEYNERPENKAKAKMIRDIPEVKAKKKLILDDIRLQVLQYYSKRLSNSDIPCCRCCGLNNTIAFLALDHITGKKQMDSEPELVKLGYSSTMQSNTLQRWIIENKFPKGFQILCHNCNKAKANPINNNECPMKNKPH